MSLHSWFKGPVLFQKETDSSEEEDIVGPMPAKGPINSNVTAEFEKRAQRMKEKLTKGDDVSFKYTVHFTLRNRPDRSEICFDNRHLKNVLFHVYVYKNLVS